MIIRIKKTNPNATLPAYAHPGDAGMDLFCVEEVALKGGERAKVPTGIAMEIPDGYVGLIWDKSGIAMNMGVKVLGGVVDCGYRGEVIVGLVNLSDETIVFEQRDKVAQMIIQKKEDVEIKEVKELSNTSRGKNGFGSTGK